MNSFYFIILLSFSPIQANVTHPDIQSSENGIEALMQTPYIPLSEIGFKNTLRYTAQGWPVHMYTAALTAILLLGSYSALKDSNPHQIELMARLWCLSGPIMYTLSTLTTLVTHHLHLPSLHWTEAHCILLDIALNNATDEQSFLTALDEYCASYDIQRAQALVCFRDFIISFTKAKQFFLAIKTNRYDDLITTLEANLISMEQAYKIIENHPNTADLNV